MANKYKLNPITGKFDIVGDGEDTPMSVTSADNSVKVTETANGVDLGVNTNTGPLKPEFDTLHEIYNKYKRRPSGNIDTEGIENHWIFPQDKSVQGNVNLPMATGSSQYGDWLLVAICISGTNGSVDTEGRITLKSFSMGSDVDPQLSNTVKFPTLDFRWRLLRGENATEPDSGVPPQLLISDMVYVPTEYKECKGQTVSPSAPTWSFDPSTDFMCVCHKVTQAEYSVSKFTANAGYSYVYYVFLRHKIWHCFYTSLEMTRIVTGSPVQCSYWTNNYHYNAAMQSPATALWNNVMKSPAWTQQGQVSVPLSYWTQYCDRSDNRGAFRDIKCQTLFGETAGNGVTALPTGTRVMAQVSTPETTGMTQSADNATDAAFNNLAAHLEFADSKIWELKTWSGLSSLNGSVVWTDGNNIYYSLATSQYVLNKSTSTWEQKTWSGLNNFNGAYVWTDGTEIYYDYGTSRYVLNKSTSTWSVKSWSGLTEFYGAYVWSDGAEIYYSNGSDQYVLNKSTATWEQKTWSGLSNFNGAYVWIDGTEIYYSNSTDQYVLNKATSTWSVKSWSGFTSIDGSKVWSDGKLSYYSDNNIQYALNLAILSDSEFAFRRSSSDTWQKVKMSDIENRIRLSSQRFTIEYEDGTTEDIKLLS